MSRVSVVLLPQSWQVSDKPDFPEQSIIKHHRPTPDTTHLKIHSKTENDPPADDEAELDYISSWKDPKENRKRKWSLLLSPRESDNAKQMNKEVYRDSSNPILSSFL